MTVLEYLTEVAGRAQKSLADKLENGETVKQALRRSFNLYNKDFNNRFLWPWRWRTISVQTTPNYTTGSVTVTNGSRTVTGSGTAWTTAMAGRFLKLNREDELYEILSVGSGSTLTLRQPYIGAGASGLSYLIWRKFYALPPEVAYSTLLHLSRWPHLSDPIDRRDIDDAFSSAYINGYPQAWALADVDRSTSAYTGGTSIAVAKDSQSLAGVGTSFLDNVFEGTELVVNSVVYNVDTIDSDTALTLVQKVDPAITTSDSYEFRSRKRTRIILSSVPDPAINLYLTYPRKQFNLTNDADEPPMWEGMEHIVADCMYGYFLEKYTSEDSYNWLKIYRDEVKEAWRSIQEMNPVDRVIKPPLVVAPSGYRRSLYG